MRPGAVVAAAFATVLAAAGPGEAVEVETFEVAGWEGRAFTDDDTGDFSHCAILADYNNGLTLIFSVGADLVWWMSLVNPDWDLEPETDYRIYYKVDGRRFVEDKGFAVDTDQVNVELGPRSAIVDQLRRGKSLRFELGRDSFGFDLDGTSTALAEAYDCTQHHVRVGTRSQPKSRVADNGPDRSSDRPEDSAMPTASERTEATLFAANLLSTIQATGYALLSAEEVPDVFADHDAVWSGSGFVGSVRIVSADEGFEVADIRAGVISSDARNCSDKFASGVMQGDTNVQPGSAHLFTACDGGDSPWSVYYTVVPRPRGGHYLVSVLSDGDGTAAARVGQDVRQAAWDIAGNE